MLFKRLTIAALLLAGIAIVAGVFADTQHGVLGNPLLAWQSQTPAKIPETLP
ncbi:hypothetical protein AAIB41_01900 [Brucella sp. BE17]|uniref:hypothetical protein n=1 Tax=Brucella sp. BE17 TaxID=3142977 RepID=UPI0031BB4F2A